MRQSAGSSRRGGGCEDVNKRTKNRCLGVGGVRCGDLALDRDRVGPVQSAVFRRRQRGWPTYDPSGELFEHVGGSWSPLNCGFALDDAKSLPRFKARRDDARDRQAFRGGWAFDGR